MDDNITMDLKEIWWGGLIMLRTGTQGWMLRNRVTNL
jgi:hypothetical protein